MILRDFESGGFPITKRSPVICTLPNGSVKVAYNRFDLKKIITINKLISCVGMWPGKKNTDCFILDPEAYTIAPPERYKDIDSATDLKVYLDPDGAFMKITYIINDLVTVESDDKELLEYVRKVKLKHQNLYAKG